MDPIRSYKKCDPRMILIILVRWDSMIQIIRDETRIQTLGGPEGLCSKIFKKKKFGISILEVDKVVLLALVY